MVHSGGLRKAYEILLVYLLLYLNVVLNIA